MRAEQIDKAAAALLEREEILTASDFVALWKDMPKPSVYSRIRALLLSGRLSRVGKGKYQAVHKPVFSVPVTEWMKEVNEFLVDACEGVNNCVFQEGKNLCVEAPKQSISLVYTKLKAQYPNSVMRKDADRFPALLEGYIIIDHLITDAPLANENNCSVPSLEKILVDGICSKQEGRMDFQRAMEVYPVNMNKLHRYASRRGVAEELSSRLSALNQDRINMFSATQKFLSTIPVRRAWVFGSFARGEETPDSDLDLLVEYDQTGKISLLEVIRYKLDLEKKIGRKVDLVENGYLKPFALPSAERDKYLIYER